MTTTDGTGVVHIAPMYGADDFGLATKNDLPKVHLVDDTGKFLEKVLIAPGKFVKDPEIDIIVIKDLASRGIIGEKRKSRTHLSILLALRHPFNLLRARFLVHQNVVFAR